MEKVYGRCENKCLVEVAPKDKTVLKDNIAVIMGKMTLEANTGDNAMNGITTRTEKLIDYPEGFNSENCIVISCSRQGNYQESGYPIWGYGWSDNVESMDTYNGITPFGVGLYPQTNTSYSNKIRIFVGNLLTTAQEVEFKLVLMKMELIEGVDYILGDVNGDGVIDENDHTMLSDIVTNNKTMTLKQFKAADVNKDGLINTGDTFKLQQYINGVIDSFE